MGISMSALLPPRTTLRTKALGYTNDLDPFHLRRNDQLYSLASALKTNPEPESLAAMPPNS